MGIKSVKMGMLWFLGSITELPIGPLEEQQFKYHFDNFLEFSVGYNIVTDIRYEHYTEQIF